VWRAMFSGMQTLRRVTRLRSAEAQPRTRSLFGGSRAIDGVVSCVEPNANTNDMTAFPQNTQWDTTWIPIYQRMHALYAEPG
jgi:hypothetical protein